MFDYKRAVILCYLLLAGGCNSLKTGFATLPCGTIVGYDLSDFNDYVNNSTHNIYAPQRAGQLPPKAEIIALEQRHKIFTLKSNVKVEYVQSDDAFTFVRILEGTHKGEEVWTNKRLMFKPH